MPVFENRAITATIQIQATPEQVFGHLTRVVDDASFKALHPANLHFRWLQGPPWQVGSVARAEKILYGKPHRFDFRITRIEPGRRIEYTPASRLVRRFFPHKGFVMTDLDGGCRLVSSATFRIGWIGRTFFLSSIDAALFGFKAYLQEEAANLKRILESPEANEAI